ncbi:MAG: carboxypeptidase M32, partial [Verrucomicrobiae bacterium]|nr:carboxypeptidase M32 [Verrucomicrobiae bacterium]
MPDATYEDLVRRLKRADTIGSVLGLLGWDEQVNLPPDSADRRAQQLQEIASLHHAAASDPEIGRLLSALESRDLAPGSDI